MSKERTSWHEDCVDSLGDDDDDDDALAAFPGVFSMAFPVLKLSS